MSGEKLLDGEPWRITVPPTPFFRGIWIGGSVGVVTSHVPCEAQKH